MQQEKGLRLGLLGVREVALPNGMARQMSSVHQN